MVQICGSLLGHRKGRDIKYLIKCSEMGLIESETTPLDYQKKKKKPRRWDMMVSLCLT